MSEAFYFTDPEGNGVELYFDRDRSTWSWTHGQIEMATVYLDPNGYLHEHLTERAADAAASGLGVGDAVVGHVHLSVGDVASAREFYVDRLGFETTASLGGIGALRLGRRLPPPHGDEHVEQRRRRAGAASPSASARSRSSCRAPTTSASSASGCRTTASRPATTVARSRFDDPWANLVEVRAAEASGD